MSAENYKSVANKLKFEGRAYINGKYVDAIDGEKWKLDNKTLKSYYNEKELIKNIKAQLDEELQNV